MNRQQVFDYAKERYGSEPERLWMRYPSYAVLRRQDTGKWYGIVMDVPKKTLGLPGEGAVDILDVKCEPMLLDLLRQSPGFLPGYHMNKANWLSILLDGTVPEAQVTALLDASFDRATGRKK